ncbi:hypothetical protein [Aquabacterium sp.]|uniref:hypothetical protein n=1 Tax=Aquabacterium sp. TaxID=1872578 RepID=UPI002C5955E0|nr:hypothetical protein [Aquabacterium sp.]HSW07270.1 hypothetical protein [Aquabacterium sp.]
MKTVTLTLLSMLFSTLSLTLASAASAAEPSPRDLHTARCVAALDVNTQDLARQVKSGQESLRRMLQDRLVAGAAFIGDSYLHGNRDEDRARALADQALAAQKNLPASELAARQAACADEGAKLFSAGNGLQRAVVKQLAKKRMDKLLGA